MIVAVVVDGTVVNLIVCESVELAQQLSPGKLCVPGEGLKIGDAYPMPENEPAGEEENEPGEGDGSS